MGSLVDTLVLNSLEASETSLLPLRSHRQERDVRVNARDRRSGPEQVPGRRGALPSVSPEFGERS